MVSVHNQEAQKANLLPDNEKGKSERTSCAAHSSSQTEARKWIHIHYSWNGAEEPVAVPTDADPWDFCKAMAVDEAAIAQETQRGEIGLHFDKEQGSIRLHYPDDTYCYYQISEREKGCQFIDGLDAIFLPGKIHGAEHQVHILYYNAQAQDGNGCWEIEIIDAEKILKVYEETSGEAQAFFEMLPDLCQGEWQSCNRSDPDFYAYAAAFATADFIGDEDGTYIDEMLFLVDWARSVAEKDPVVTDDDLFCEAGDEIGNAVHQALAALSYNHLDWDMALIGEAATALESILNKHGKCCCYPFVDEDGCICYASEDRCKHCKGKKKYD